MFSVTKYSIGKYYQHITAIPGISMQTPAMQLHDRPCIFWISLNRRKYQENQLYLIYDHKKLPSG